MSLRLPAITAAMLLVFSALDIRPVHAQAPSREGVAFFEKHVRPLLIKRCYKCHSQQAKELRGGLSLESRPGWEKGGDSGPAVVPGKPDESLLVDAVRYGSLEMPPDGKLPAKEIALLEQWVKMGAPDPRVRAVVKGMGDPSQDESEAVLRRAEKSWAFQPLARADLPAVEDASAWCKTAIDRFVLAKQQSLGLFPAPPADRRTLIRRACFDLLGLPPDADDVERFIRDPAPDDVAYARLIDRLLASPRYGERWGRHWLDVARFAESHGFEQDYNREFAFHFRDFVIKALNDDLPFDQFVRWQIAGDEYAPDDPLAMMATGFLGAGVFPTQITAREVEQSRYDALDDMAATVGTGFLGLTIGCARCHDHKFDPIPTRDYYRLVSTFTTTVRSNIDLELDPAATKAAKESFQREHAPLAEALARFEREELPARMERWLKDRPQGKPEKPGWIVLKVREHQSEGGASFLPLADGSLLASGPNPRFDTYTFLAATKLEQVTAVRLEALAHSSLVKGGPGRAANGNFGLSDFRLTAAPLAGEGQPRDIKLINPKATFDQKGLPVANAVDQDKKTCWAVDPQFGKDHAAVFELATPLEFKGGAVLKFTLQFKNNSQHSIGRPRLSASSAPPPVGLKGAVTPAEVVEALQRLKDNSDTSQLGEQQRKALLAWYRPRDSRWRELNRRVAEHAKTAPKPKLTKVMVTSEGFKPIRHHTQGADFFEQTYFLKRGDPVRKGKVVSQSFLRALMTAPQGERHWQQPPPEGWRTSYRRRALAEWITDTRYGAGRLLARVIVNRLWQHHFGRGIVGTPNDFGSQGELPTHPRLLDWLATELMRHGWRLKPLHRLIMTSATYRQSGRLNSHCAKIDPNNRFLWRRTPRRLEAESIRDTLLRVTGALQSPMYGPGTLDEGMRRRSVYFMIKRSKLIKMMQLFDAPEPNTSIGRRPNTTIAPQALLFLNNPHVRGWAKEFAHRLAPRGDASWPQAITRGYRIALGRSPTEAELTDAETFLRRQSESHGKTTNGGEARALALADYCQVLMSLNELIYVD